MGNSTDLTGGGISNDSDASELFLYHVTVANNTADFDNTADGDGGGLHLISGTITMQNSIVAGNWVGAAVANDCTVDNPINATYSLVQVLSGCSISGSDNLIGIDPLLQPLSENGGAFATYALDESSPLIDLLTVGTSGCGTKFLRDQRGLKRPFHHGCDIGAFEFGSFPYRWFFPLISNR